MEAIAENQTTTNPADTEAQALEAKARAFVIISDEDFTRADELLVIIGNEKRKIGEDWDSVIAKAHDAHKDALAKKKEKLAPYLAAEAIIRPRMVEYRTVQKAAAEKAAAAAAAVSKVAAEDHQIFVAHNLEQSGRGQEALAVLSQPIIAPPPTVSWSPVPASKGTSFKEVWKMRVVSLPDLLKGIAEGRVPEHFVIPAQANESTLNAYAKAMKGNAKVDGVEFYQETVTAVRAGK